MQEKMTKEEFTQEVDRIYRSAARGMTDVEYSRDLTARMATVDPKLATLITANIDAVVAIHKYIANRTENK